MASKKLNLISPRESKINEKKLKEVAESYNDSIGLLHAPPPYLVIYPFSQIVK